MGQSAVGLLEAVSWWLSKFLRRTVSNTFINRRNKTSSGELRCWIAIRRFEGTMGQQEHESEGSVKHVVSEATAPVDTTEILNMVSPPGSKTPPSNPVKRTLFFPASHGTQSESQPVDPDTLAKALKDYDDAGRRRERTPGTSPSRKRQRVYGDR